MRHAAQHSLENMAVRVLKYIALTMAARRVIGILLFVWVGLVMQAGSDLFRAFVTKPSMIDDATFLKPPRLSRMIWVLNVRRH
jgi:hypothetical protein